MEKRKLINYIGLTGLIALISYMAAMIFAPMAYPGYNWMEQAVSDLSADNAPSRKLWNLLAAFYNSGGVVCSTCISIYISERKIYTKLFRVGVHLFTIMNWISKIGYSMFPLSDAGKDIEGFQEIMHIVVTAAVVILSIVSLTILIVAGCRKKEVRGIGIWAAVALIMMFVGAAGRSMVPPEYFGVVERFSLVAAVGYNAVLGIYLFNRFE